MCLSPARHLPPGEGHIGEHALPGRAVAAVAVVEDGWWLVIDPQKADAAEHAHRLLAGMDRACSPR